MIEIITLEEMEKWDNVVKSIPNYDVYYLNGYVRAFALHGDGEPVLVSFIVDDARAACVLMIRDVSNDFRFKNLIEKGVLFDAVTPYGYGGFIISGSVDFDLLSRELLRELAHRDIVSVFFRFHPVLDNAKKHDEMMQVIPLGHTIAMDLFSPDIIWNNITSKNRNMIRKAEKQGVEILHGKGKELLGEFKKIYNATMDHDNADDYYYFKDEFYNSIDNDLKDNYEIFYAIYQGEIIAMSIMIFANRFMNYHLSGSKYEFRRLAPSNLLLYKAALWGLEQGFKTLHLGGGLGSGEDNLYKFKASFNRNSNYRFAIGKWIIDENKYNYLVSLREINDKNFNPESNYFPLYRS